MHPDLRGSYRSTLLGAWLIFGLAGLLSLARVALAPLGTRAEIGNAILYGSVAAICFLGAGLYSRVALWYRRCSTVYKETRAVPMILRVISNGRAVFLELHDLTDQARRSPHIRIQCQGPAWDARALDGETAKVYIASKSDGPVVVETRLGVLWPAPLSRRFNRVEGVLV